MTMQSGAAEESASRWQATSKQAISTSAIKNEVSKDLLHAVEVLGGVVLTIDGARRVTLEGMGMALLGLGLLQRGVSGFRAQHAPLASVHSATRAAPEARIHWQYIDKTIVIARPVEVVYHAWHDIENLPYYMPHLKMVQLTGTKRSRWTARAPAGLSVAWEAEITREMPNSLVAWHSMPGSDIPNQGTIRFERLADNSTRLRISLRYGPPAGRLGVFVARLLGKEPGQFIEADLYRFKHMLELGDAGRDEAAEESVADAFDAPPSHPPASG